MCLKDSNKIKIGIIGDYDGRPSHIATEESLKHSSKLLHSDLEYVWLPTPFFEKETWEGLSEFDGIWCAPGSPYKSMNGAIHAIHFVRETNKPFIGTCGGFQHAAIEYGRNVLCMKELQDKCFDFYKPNPYISSLSCSLVSQSREIIIDRDTRLFKVYKAQQITEKYNCSFGLNRQFQQMLKNNGLSVCGFDENGEARIMSLENKPFYVITLFQPQLSSTYDKPHCLVTEFVQAAIDYSEQKKKFTLTK